MSLSKSQFFIELPIELPIDLPIELPIELLQSPHGSAANPQPTAATWTGPGSWARTGLYD